MFLYFPNSEFLYRLNIDPEGYIELGGLSIRHNHGRLISFYEMVLHFVKIRNRFDKRGRVHLRSSCAAERSFSEDARHLAMKSPGVMVPVFPSRSMGRILTRVAAGGQGVRPPFGGSG